MIRFSEQQSPIEQSVLSTENFVVLCNDSLTLQPVDPAGLVIEFQLVNGGLPPRAQPSAEPKPPQSTGWVMGNFVTSGTNLCYAQVPIGPEGPLDVPAGRYAVWAQCGDQVQPVGQIIIR